MRKNIVFLDRSTFPSNIIFPKLGFNHKWKNHNFTKVKEVKKRIEKAHIIITNKRKKLTFWPGARAGQKFDFAYIVLSYNVFVIC